MLDLRFKDLGFKPTKFESTKDELKYKMMKSIKNNNYSLSNNNSPTSLLSSLFEETTHQLCPIETELKIYFDIPKMLLCISETSVPSEHLFSNTGSTITDKRARFHPNTVHDLLFLKENQHCFNPYPDLE
ncbi:24859_t:CDS:2 [Cetraspora pellucida]|uniref:24859_t:CDS:1 n=1 Tax=Cetraspora pellucida TaxID=1433469 RepID=A0A9N8WAG7_9GLOM|nr:24859_t:CDS:2 [Cetraspora pellucida]